MKTKNLTLIIIGVLVVLALAARLVLLMVNKFNTPKITPTPITNQVMTEAEARVIAEKSCIKGGEALSAGTYNEVTKTWWFDANLNATREGCNPACVVSEENKAAEINWRCTGLKEPASIDNIVTPTEKTKLANPASTNCLAKGGQIQIQTRTDGSQYGLCFFDDNRACEEWAMMRGSCPVGGVKTTGYDDIAQKFCAWSGGQTVAQPNAMCIFKNGSKCLAQDFYDQKCLEALR